MRPLAVVIPTVLLSAAILTPTGAAAAPEGNYPMHFVVDTSGSMSGLPLTQAKTALREMNTRLPEGVAVGLRTYGGSCGNDGNLLIPVGPHDAQRFDTAVDAMTASGGTPTPDALRAAAADLPDSGNRTIVLISDGQSTCGNPCTTAAELERKHGIHFTVHTVGFNATAGASTELKCIADTTGGSYYDARDPEALADALLSIVDSTEVDTDGDGFTDREEREGIRVGDDYVDLKALGADPNRKDLFLWIEWTKDSQGNWLGRDTNSPKPSESDLEDIKHAFRIAPVDRDKHSDGIRLHIKLADGPIDRGQELTPNGEDSMLTIDSMRRTALNPAEQRVYRYGLIGHRRGTVITKDSEGNEKRTSSHSSGIASAIPGKSFYVAKFPNGRALGDPFFKRTIMHEYGHTLGLGHGGPVSIFGFEADSEKDSYAESHWNCKPGYYSIMNYIYQRRGYDGEVNGSDYSRRTATSSYNKNEWPAGCDYGDADRSMRIPNMPVGEFHIENDWENLIYDSDAWWASAGGAEGADPVEEPSIDVFDAQIKDGEGFAALAAPGVLLKNGNHPSTLRALVTNTSRRDTTYELHLNGFVDIRQNVSVSAGKTVEIALPVDRAKLPDPGEHPIWIELSEPELGVVSTIEGLVLIESPSRDEAIQRIQELRRTPVPEWGSTTGTLDLIQALNGIAGVTTHPAEDLCTTARTQGPGTTLNGYRVVLQTGGSGAEIVLGDDRGGMTLSGGSGNDIVCAFGGTNTLDGGSGNDTLVVVTGTGNKLAGRSGADVLIGMSDDTFTSGPGKKTIIKR